MRPASISVWVCVGLFACAALPLCLSNYDHGRAFSDQMNYHYPAIVHFVNGGGLVDYPSATTPGFHLLLAVVAKWISGTEVALKLANFLITAVLLGSIAGYVSRQVNSVSLSVVMLLPMVFSIYILPSGVWLLPDNLAWLSVFCVLYLVLSFRHDWSWYTLTALSLVAAVLVRQSNVWLAAVVFVAAWLGGPREGAGTVEPRGDPDTARRQPMASRLAAAGLAVAPSIAVLSYFFSLWHAMTPPAFVQRHTGLNLAAIPFFLCLLAFYSVFYLPLILRRAVHLLRESRARNWLWAGALSGLLASLITPTDWDPVAGRVSGLWGLARILPDMQHRSVSIAFLAILGGMMAAGWLLMIEPRMRPIIVSAALGFVAAQAANHFVYERYFAGLVFLLILPMVGNVLVRQPERPPRWGLAGPLVFAIFNAGVLAAGLVSG